MIRLPESPDAFADATWAEVAPWYDALAEAPLASATAEAWLATWSRLEELVAEAGTRALIAYTCDTADAGKERTYLRFFSEIFPKSEAQQVRLARRLLDLDIPRRDLQPVLEQFRMDVRIFRDENVPLHAELEALAAEYQKITGGLSADWDGEPKTIPQLQPYLQDADRGVRERAFRLGARAYLEKRDALADLFDRMYERRQALARNAGFADYQAYAFAAKHRADYTPDDCRRFHEAVEQVVVPAAERLLAYRRECLDLGTLRPWDLAVDPDGAPPLRPFADDAGFVSGAQRAFTTLDPQFGAWFGEMERAGLLDLESRPGKAPGGYCTKLAAQRVPFIFMNAVGVADDVNTLVHEAGHCFHAFEAREHPFIWQRGTGSEAAELASMAMELLAAPHLVRPTGYYSSEDARRAQLEHLEDVIFSLPHIASVDAFQAWIYTSGRGHDAAARDAAWLEIRARFERGIDWSGLEAERTARWYRQLHIFEYPFYYIEYGIAQLGALQVWRRSLQDPADAVRRYREALRLGGTARLPEIYAAAGARLVFDAATMSELVGLVEARIAELRRAARISPALGVPVVARR
ncbi:MAG: M3 family oligoendopeptidase [Gemmatimonadota bacterium]|jgi:oligoendopeptidase F|nr:M3 family oligoendopeptidase [Gemmatimonadota bacterium]